IAADANSMTYVLHKAIGDEVVLTHGEQPLRLKLVAALADSVFQGELLMSEANFVKLFPEQQGYRFPCSTRPRIAPRGSARRSKKGPATWEQTRYRRRSGWPSSMPSRTPTCPRSRRLAGSGCW